MSKRPTTIDQLEEIAASKLTSAKSAIAAAAQLVSNGCTTFDLCRQLDIALSYVHERAGVLDAITILKQADRRDAQREATK
jgi:hypothetical protein